MTLLDCAFSFFANFPCRLLITEMKFDLPCEEVLFSSRHPFSEPKFKLSRGLTTYDAFKSLFIPEIQSSMPSKRNPLRLNAMDMFILIHCAYTCPTLNCSSFNCSSTLRIYTYATDPLLLLKYPISRPLRHIHASNILLASVKSRSYQMRFVKMA